jgi:hypothetical protein
MPKISIEAALGAGFSLIRRRPLSVAAWGLIYTAFLAGQLAMEAPFFIQLLSQFAAGAKNGIPQSPDMGMMIQMQGVVYLLDLVGGGIGVVLYCAVFRAVLHPERGRFAYLRLGAAEGWLFILMIAGVIGLVVAAMAMIIPGAIVVAVLAANHAAAASVIVGVLGVIGLIGGAIYLALRFSLVGPMIVEDGKFHLFESWTLTKGNVGSLIALLLCLMAILIVADGVRHSPSDTRRLVAGIAGRRIGPPRHVVHAAAGCDPVRAGAVAPGSDVGFDSGYRMCTCHRHSAMGARLS